NFGFDDVAKKNIEFLYDQFHQIDHGPLIYGVDMNGNSFVLYHKNIDTYNMLLLLKMFNCRDAILLCDSTKANLICKESGSNRYNKTDFIGNPKKFLSNIIAFSG